MSLNELVSTDYKPWLDIQANNVIIDGDLSVRNSQPNYILGYGPLGNVSFSPQLRIVNLSIDTFGIVPLQNATDTKLDFEAGPLPSTNFTINGNDDLVCGTAGTYLLICKFVEAGNSGTSTSRPNPYLQINNVSQNSFSIRTPFAIQPFSDYSGMETTSIYTLAVNDVLKLQLAIQPSGSGTINMMNQSFASNMTLIKIA